MYDQMIGRTIKLHRRKKRITLQGLSDRTGLSISYLSMLERGLSSPTIANLNSICEALDMTMSELILKLDTPQVLVQKDQRRTILSNPGYLYEAATEGKHQMSCVVMTVKDSLVHVSNPHVADEVGFIVKGSLAMTMDGDEYILNKGDCIYIDANTDHSYHKLGDEECVSVWVYASPHATPTADSYVL